jgi:hypothetical protein
VSGHTPGYEVTEDGRVFSVGQNWRGYGRREMQQTPNADGYPSVRILVNGVRRRLAVHRLVAARFLPARPSPQHEIRHLDGNKNNAHFTNLAWGTAKDNADDRERHGRTAHLKGERNPNARLTADQADAIRRLAAEGRSQRGIASVVGLSQSTVGLVVRGQSWR